MRYIRQLADVRFAMLVALLAACFVMGGASRLDVTSLVFLQPFAAICAVAFLLIPGTQNWPVIRIPLLFLASLAGLMVAQLVPLPPSVWANLPGHAAFAQSSDAIGLRQPWRPISLSPDLTLASLVGLILPLAVLLGLAGINNHQRRSLLTVLIAGSAVSALFGLAQVSGGMQSPFYLYRITNLGSAVGLFSNRNHQAVLIAMTWPMLAAWAMEPHRDARRRAAGRWMATGFALFLLPLLLVTGSRAGLGLGILALAAAALIWRRPQEKEKRVPRSFERFVVPSLVIAGATVLLATIFLSRAEAIQRLLKLSVGEDTRLEATPLLTEMVRDFFPIGTGFGTFDPIFRYYEPTELLDTKYLNHAHNDVFELAISAGLPGIVLALVFLAWFVRLAMRAWKTSPVSFDTSLARVASLMILFVLASSVVDYPLRTPLMMAIFAIACGWLSNSAGHSAGDTPEFPASKTLYRQAVSN